MPIRFRCQDCRSRVKVPEGSQGKQVKCPRCGRIQSVPRHHSSQTADSQKADGLTVHTCVGSMHRAPKRKEALVGAGTESDYPQTYEGGGGAPGGNGLDIPQHTADDLQPHGKPTQRVSRKERRRMAARERELRREREEAIARQEEAQEQELITESRLKVQDLFASSNKKNYSQEDGVASPGTTKILVASSSKPTGSPDSLALNGGGHPIEPVAEPAALEVEQHEQRPQAVETSQPPSHTHEESEASGRWTFDMTAEAYPFLRVIPWVLRITALMLIGPAFKVMLVADAQGFSGVVSLLILFMGLALVVVTWTVGEIATAVRDIALRKAAG